MGKVGNRGVSLLKIDEQSRSGMFIDTPTDYGLLLETHFVTRYVPEMRTRTLICAYSVVPRYFRRLLRHGHLYSNPCHFTGHDDGHRSTDPRSGDGWCVTLLTFNYGIFRYRILS